MIKVHSRAGCRALRPIELAGDIAFVLLSNGLKSTIDAADVPLVEGRNWSAHVRTGRSTAYRTSGGKTVMMHRLIMDAPAGLDVDHINGDPLDNRRANLRIATRAQNIRNMRDRPGRDLPKGVRRHWRNGAFIASIKFNYKYIHLGTFQTVEAAAAARRAVEDLYFGEFARR